MRSEKIAIILSITLCLVIASGVPAAAFEKAETVEDSTGDVFDYESFEAITENAYFEIDNIDISQVDYTITDDTIEFTITVVGEIQDMGSLDELDPEATIWDIESVTYSFILTTSDDMIEVTYANQTARVTDSLAEITNLTEDDFTVNDNALTVSFEWNTTGQTFTDIMVTAQYMRFKFDLADLTEEDLEDFEDLEESAIIWLADIVPNGPLYIEAEVTNLAEVGQEVEFDGIVMDGYPPYEYHWDFGDGESSTDIDPTHAYDAEGEYTYTFTVTDSEQTEELYEGLIEIVPADDNDSPGFELVAVIAALGCIFLFLRRKQR